MTTVDIIGVPSRGDNAVQQFNQLEQRHGRDAQPQTQQTADVRKQYLVCHVWLVGRDVRVDVLEDDVQLQKVLGNRRSTAVSRVS